MGYAIGIDLGTSNCCVGVFRDGKVEIIPNECGNRTTPSFVAFTDTGRVYGDAAKSQVDANPKNTIFAALRLIGRKFADPAVKSDKQHWSFNVRSGKNDRHQYEVRTRMYSSDQYYPEEIIAMMLVKMKESAEAFLKSDVTGAVITVPAHFNRSYRRAIFDAAEIAGLNVLRIINAPTAAAIAYRVENKVPTDRCVLVFDFGGGTVDVSIVSFQDGKFRIRSTASDHHLGGEDLVNRLFDHFRDEFVRKNSLSVYEEPVCSRLRSACEKVMHQLTRFDKTSIQLQKFVGSTDFNSSIDRHFFDGICFDLFRKALDVVYDALRRRVNKNSIDEVVLVGGCSRIPKIQQLLSEYFSGKEIKKSVNPDEFVAHGAAIQAALLSGDKSEGIQGMLIDDVVPSSLHVVFDDCHRNDGPFVKRYTAIPLKISETRKITYDSQTEISIKVYEGEESYRSCDDTMLGEMKLNGIPLRPGTCTAVEVTFEIDIRGTLTVTARDHRTGKTGSITVLDEANCFSKEDIAKFVTKAEWLLREDQVQREGVAAKNRLKAYCTSTMMTIEANKRKRKAKDQEEMKAYRKCQRTLTWMESNELAGKAVFEEKLEEVEEFNASRGYESD